MTSLASEQILPSEEIIEIARESSRSLSAILQKESLTQQIDVHGDKGAVRVLNIPTSALRLMLEALTEMSEGNAVSITSIHSVMTTQEAADILNVSRPFLVQLLENGEIPFHKVGTHRRVRYEDVLGYKKSIDAKRRKALDELAAQAQELGMGY